MTVSIPALERLLAEATERQALIYAGETRRMERRAADAAYAPPQAGTIDSSLYLLNLRAVQGQRLALTLDALLALIAAVKALHDVPRLVPASERTNPAWQTALAALAPFSFEEQA